MSPLLDIESTLTDRYQTTVPETIRRALRLGKRDKLHYTILPGGEVMLTRAQPHNVEDPLIGQFLDFLTQDISNNPQRLQTVSTDLVQHIQSLINETRINLDEPLSADDE